MTFLFHIWLPVFLGTAPVAFVGFSSAHYHDMGELTVGDAFLMLLLAILCTSLWPIVAAFLLFDCIESVPIIKRRSN